MDLTLFIKRSKSENANLGQTINSFKHDDIVLKEIIYIDNLFEINYGNIKTEWWMVIYDNEIIDPKLLEVIPFFVKFDVHDTFVLYRSDLDGKITYCPRLFKNWITTHKDYLYPTNAKNIETILNGWIFEQGYPL